MTNALILIFIYLYFKPELTSVNDNNFISLIPVLARAWEYNSVVEHLSSTLKALSSMHNTTHKNCYLYFEVKDVCKQKQCYGNC